jgi:DNA-binding MarR family transcriptional regulator
MEPEMEEDPLSAHVVGALLKSASSVRNEVYKKLQARDLTLRQFTAMEVLYRVGPVSLGELAGEIALSTETAGKVVSGLEKRNLVARRRDERNKNVVALTTEGGRLINTLYPVHHQLVEQVMGRLTQAEQEKLTRLCGRLFLAEEGLCRLSPEGSEGGNPVRYPEREHLDE